MDTCVSEGKKYGYSLYEEGPFIVTESWEAAHDDAILLALDEKYDSYYLGVMQKPTVNAAYLGARIQEILQCELYDQVGEVSEVFTLSGNEQTFLGQAVLDAVEKLGGFRCWFVDDVKRYATDIAAVIPEPT